MTIRQGDLLFTKVDKQTTGNESQKLVIAQGEQTGHHHVLVAQTDSVILGDKTLFTVKGKAKLVHPEHDIIDFPDGTYMVTNEREWDYIENDLVKVRD